MDDVQESKLSMYQAVAETLSNNQPVWQNVGAFVTADAEFRGEVAAIESLAEDQLDSSKGVTANKQRLRGELSKVAVEVASGLKALASMTNNDELAGQVKFTASSFLHERDNDAKEYGQVVLSRANEHAAELANYRVDAAKIAELQTALAAYKAVIAAPRAKISATAAATEELEAAFSRADVILNDQLDNLVELFQRDNATFYLQYQNARQIINPGSSSPPDDPGPDSPPPT